MAEKFWATGMWRILFDGLRTRVRRLHKAIPDQEPEPIQSLDDFIRKTLTIRNGWWRESRERDEPRRRRKRSEADKDKRVSRPAASNGPT